MAEKSLLLFALLFAIFNLLSIKYANSDGANVIDIAKFGAKPNTDATEGLTLAWKEACASITPSKVMVPSGSYILRAVDMKGPCKSPIELEVWGNFKAPAEPMEFMGSDTWVRIERVDHLTFTAPQPGNGIFDGQGTIAWEQNDCTQTGKCGRQLPFNFRFNYITNSVIKGITSLDSKLFHMKLFGCKNVTLDGVTVTAPKESPNTDGIVITRSSDVKVLGAIIGTGDDCMSIGEGTKNLLVENVTCGPGRGISVGSLGKLPNEESVEQVRIKGCTFRNADNGVRVKTWKHSYENWATGLFFEDITIDNVWYPIIVDQDYCPYQHCNGATTPSKVKLTDVMFKNIKGTTSNREAVKLVCSETPPCEKIQLIDIDLEYKGSNGPAVSVCKNVKPITSGKQNPIPCTQKEAAASPLPDTEAIETTDV